MVLFTLAHRILLGYKINGFQLKQLEQYLLRPLCKLAHTHGPFPGRSLQYAERKWGRSLKGMVGKVLTYISVTFSEYAVCDSQANPVINYIVIKARLTHLD